MQIQGLNFLKVQKSLRAKSIKKISDEYKGRLSNNEVFGFSMVLGEKNKDGGVNMVVWSSI